VRDLRFAELRVDGQRQHFARRGLRRRELHAAELLLEHGLPVERNRVIDAARDAFGGQALAAIRLLADLDGMGISPARMTLSTAGVVPGIERLGQEAVRPKLAVSLNAPTDELRDRIGQALHDTTQAITAASRRKLDRARELLDTLVAYYALLEQLSDHEASLAAA